MGISAQLLGLWVGLFVFFNILLFLANLVLNFLNITSLQNNAQNKTDGLGVVSALSPSKSQEENIFLEDQWLSKCSHLSNSISLSCKPVRNAHAWAPLQDYWFRNCGVEAQQSTLTSPPGNSESR